MPVTITPVDIGSAPGDGTGEGARTAFGQLNINEAAIKAAIEALEADAFTSDVATVADQDYVLWYNAPYAGTVTAIRTDCASGTCTLTGKINTTALGGTANSGSSTASEQAHATSNTFVKDDVLKFTVSANSACLTRAVIFYITRTS